MTNEQIYIEMVKRDELILAELNAVKLELASLRGKQYGFLAMISLVFTIITNVGINLITKGK